MKASKKLIGVIALAIMTAAVSAAAIMGDRYPDRHGRFGAARDLSPLLREQRDLHVLAHRERGTR